MISGEGLGSRFLTCCHLLLVRLFTIRSVSKSPTVEGVNVWETVGAAVNWVTLPGEHPIRETAIMAQIIERTINTKESDFQSPLEPRLLAFINDFQTSYNRKLILIAHLKVRWKQKSRKSLIISRCFRQF